MADKIPSDVRMLALSLHTDLQTLNTYAGNRPVALALIDTIREKITTINNSVDDIAIGSPEGEG